MNRFVHIVHTPSSAAMRATKGAVSGGLGLQNDARPETPGGPR